MTGSQEPRTESLVHSFQEGAAQAFTPLYERLAPALYAWSVLRAPKGIDPTDLLGEVWLDAVRSLARYDASRATFRAWLFGVAKHVLLRELRLLERREALAARESRKSLDLEGVPESVTSLSRRTERDELLLHFLERVDRLGPEERELVLYCGLEGYSCGEAAVRLGLTEEATTKRWQRLRAELRNSQWAEELLA
jgi:RNA polymerase sigma-70 factor (ECF subfamily)